MASNTLGEYRSDSLAAEEVLTLANWCLLHDAGDKRPPGARDDALSGGCLSRRLARLSERYQGYRHAARRRLAQRARLSVDDSLAWIVLPLGASARQRIRDGHKALYPGILTPPARARWTRPATSFRPSGW